MTPLRMTTRRWMIVVAAAGALLGAKITIDWRNDYLRLAFIYSSLERPARVEATDYELLAREQDASAKSEFAVVSRSRARELLRRAEYYRDLSVKYERAARNPWFPVPADPPPPE